VHKWEIERNVELFTKWTYPKRRKNDTRDDVKICGRIDRRAEVLLYGEV
jgi:hypothetical protein